MKRSVGVKWGNLKTGLILIFALAVMMWASLSGTGTSIFESKGHFVCFFKNVNGLVNGSPVWMSGVEVGNVRSVSFVNIDKDRQVKVVCRVTRAVWPMLTKDVAVQLGTIGLLGDKYVEIVPGSSAFAQIEQYDTVMTNDVGSADAMFKTGEEAMANVGSVVTNLDSLLGRMNRGEGTLGKIATDEAIYNQTTQLLANLTKLAADLQGNQERLVASFETTSQALADVSDQVKKNSGTLGKIINDPALYDNLSATSASLDTIMTKINNAEGTLGLFVNDTALYSEFTTLMTRVSNLVADIEENPRKYFKFSVF